MFRYAVLLMLALAAWGQDIDLSQSSFSREQLYNSTGFLEPGCIPENDFYQYRIANGMPATLEFHVFLACKGVPASGDTVTVPAGQRSRVLSIDAPQGSVRNTPCSLTLEADDPFDSDPNAPRIRYATFNSTCGGTIIDDDDGCRDDDDCNFIDIPCQLETGTWYHSFSSMALLYAIGIGFAVAVLMIILWKREDSRIKRLNAASDNSAHWQMTVRKVQKDNGYNPPVREASSKAAGSKAGGGRMMMVGGDDEEDTYIELEEIVHHQDDMHELLGQF